MCHFALKDYICVMLGFVSAYLHMMKDCMKYKTKQKALDSEKGEYTFRHAMGKVGIAHLFWVQGKSGKSM